MFPTFAEIAGFEPPADLDGISLVPTLFGDPGDQKDHEFLYWEFLERGGKKAVTTTKWKAIQLDTMKPEPRATLLFDLEADPSETTDVAADYPEVVREMEAWIETSHTPPTP